MSKGLYKLAVLFALAGLMVVFNNCGKPFGMPTGLRFQHGEKLLDTDPPAEATPESIEAFKATVYPITRSRCISCHSVQNPTTAHEDPQVAHDSIIEMHKADFESPANSRLVKKLRDELHNCWGDCNQNADEMQVAITKWAQAFKAKEAPKPANSEAEATGILTERSRSIARELIDPKNKNGEVVSISFDISQFLGFPDVWFVVDVAEYDEYSYKFSNPRIKTATEKIHVKNVKLLINGKYNPQHALYTVIDKTTTASDRILSTSALVALKDRGPEEDQVSFAFEKLRLVSMQNQSLVAFETSVYKVTRDNCSSCHSTANTAHASTSSQTAHDAVLSRSLVNFTTEANSPLYRKLKVERHNCGRDADCDVLADQMLQAIQNWKANR